MPGLSSFLGGLSGGTLGTVLVEVGLDTRALNAGLAKTQAEVKGSSVGMGNAFKAAFVTSSAIAAVAITKFAVSAVHAYEEHQVALTLLQKAMSNNPAIIDKSTSAFAAQAEALSHLSGFTSTQILSAEALGARYKLTSDQLGQLNSLSVDYARLTGVDVVSAEGQLGRALAGNGRALKAIGVRWVDTKNTAKNFAELMQKAGPIVAGAAAAYGTTLAGALAKVHAEWENLLVVAGSRGGFLTSLANFAAETIKNFGQGTQVIGNFIGSVKNAAIDLANVLTTIANSFNTYFTNPMIEALNVVIRAYDALVGTIGGTKIATIAHVQMVKPFTEVQHNAWLTIGGGPGAVPAQLGDLSVHLNAAGKVVGNFAGLTGKDFKTWKTTSVAAMDAVKAALTDLASKSKITAAKVVDAFVTQATALQNYAVNLATLHHRHLPGALLKELVDLGTKGIATIAQLADANTKDFNREVAAMMKAYHATNAVNRALNQLNGKHVAATIDLSLDYFTHGAAFPKPDFKKYPKTGFYPAALGFEGMVTKPTLFLTGERSSEYVKITPRRHASTGGTVVNNNVYLNVAGSVVSERDLISVVHKGLLQLKRRNGGSLGFDFDPRYTTS